MNLAAIAFLVLNVSSAWAASNLVLYDHVVSPAFTQSAFGVSASNTCDSTVYYSAPCSFEIGYQGWGGINFGAGQGPIISGSYSSIDWNLNTNGQPIEDFSVLFLDANGAWINQVVLTPGYVSQNLAGGWVQVSVPILDINPNNTPVGAIQLKNAVNQALAPVYIDYLRLTGSGPSSDYSLTVSPAAQTVSPGGNTTYAASATLVNAIDGTIALTSAGLPSGTTASFSPPALSGGDVATMTVTTTANTPAGTYPMQVIGSNGLNFQTATTTLIVSGTVTQTPDFSITGDGASHAGSAGGTITVPLTVAYWNGFAGTVSLTVGGLPINATASISPSALSASGAAVLEVVTAENTPSGTSTLTVTATSGAIVHTATVTLVISAGATPTSLISRGVPSFASSEIYPASYANDNDYLTQWRGTIPGWIAYDLSGTAPAKRNNIVLAWYNDPTTGNYDHTRIGMNAYNNLSAYTIEGNAASGGGPAPTTGWVTLASVTENTLHSRQHQLSFAGYNWIRLNVSASDGSVENADAEVNLDVYSADGILSDDWIFFGDSITAGSMSHETIAGYPTFSQMINNILPANFPLQEGGGIAYLTSAEGAQWISQWLPLFPGKYVGLSYGTNDALGCVAPATFYNNYATMVQAVIAAGKTPLVPHIPWGPMANIQSCAPSLNAQIDNLYAAFPQIVRGPDLWAYFQSNQSLISSDGIHPSSDGMSALRQQWANSVIGSVYGRSASGAPLLPGQQTWKGGVSSYLFGANDTQEWSDDNVETDPYNIIQPSLKSGGLTLMRTFFFAHSLLDGHATTDAEVDLRIATVERAGMQCLGVLQDIVSPEGVAFAQHVVSRLGSRCNLYEFGNEDDLNGVTIQTYLQQWNSLIPQLRALNPNAKFMGPVTYNDQGNTCTYSGGQAYCFMRNFLLGVKASGVLPDAITFHYYPCSGDGQADCLAKVNYYTTAINNVRGWIQSDLDINLPLGITEWNMDPGSNAVLGNDPSFMAQFTASALNLMIQAKLDFANQFDVQSYGGYGALDMFDINNHDQPKAQFNTLVSLIQQYKQ